MGHRCRSDSIQIREELRENVQVPEQQVEINLRKGKNVLGLKTESSGDNWTFYPVIKAAAGGLYPERDDSQAGKAMEDLRFEAQDAAPADNPYAHAFFVNAKE